MSFDNIQEKRFLLKLRFHIVVKKKTYAISKVKISKGKRRILKIEIENKVREKGNKIIK